MKLYTPSMIKVLINGLGLARTIYSRNSAHEAAVISELEDYLNSLGYTLEGDVRKRILAYTRGSAITNHVFAQTRGEKVSREETMNSVYMGAFTPIADDIMDSTGMTFEEVMNAEVDSGELALFQYLLEKATQLRKLNPAFDEYFVKAHVAQDNSVQQVQPERLSEGQLEKISFEKGGYYNLWWRTLLNHPLRDGEEDAIYLLGGILQLSNDSFDVYKDYHSGQQTLVTNHLDFHQIEERYLSMTSDFRDLHFKMDYPSKYLKNSFTTWSIITAQGLVAIRHYKKLQGNSPKLQVEKYDRKTLITDMQTVPNMIRNGFVIREL